MVPSSFVLFHLIASKPQYPSISSTAPVSNQLQYTFPIIYPSPPVLRPAPAPPFRCHLHFAQCFQIPLRDLVCSIMIVVHTANGPMVKNHFIFIFSSLNLCPCEWDFTRTEFGKSVLFFWGVKCRWQYLGCLGIFCSDVRFYEVCLWCYALSVLTLCHEKKTIERFVGWRDDIDRGRSQKPHAGICRRWTPVSL